MRHRDQKRLAFFKRLADKPEFEVFKIAKAAVEQLGRGRGGRLRQIALFGKQDGQAPPRSVARDPASVDATANDEQIGQLRPPCICHVVILPPEGVFLPDGTMP